MLSGFSLCGLLSCSNAIGLPVLISVSLGDGTSTNWSFHFSCDLISNKLVKFIRKCIIVQCLTEHVNLHLAHIHVLLMICIQFFPISD